MRSRKTSTVSPAFSSGDLPGDREFLQGHAALGFQSHVDQHHVVLDRDDLALDRRCLRGRLLTQCFIEERREALLALFLGRGELTSGHYYSANFPKSTSGHPGEGRHGRPRSGSGAAAYDPYSCRKNITNASQACGVDEPDRRIEGGVGVERRGVELECVGRPHQGRDPALSGRARHEASCPAGRAGI